MWASEYGHTSVVKLLLANGAEVDLLNKVNHHTTSAQFYSCA